VSASVQYAVGGVNGKVKTAPLTFLNFTVPNQAFSMFRNLSLSIAPTCTLVQVNASSNYPAGQGLIGLGPNVGSNVHDALKKQPQGDTVLDRIFRQDPNTPNTLTVLLSRSYDPTEQYPGDITVSDILPGMQNISEQPKLPVKTVPSSRSGGQHWQVLLDPNGIIAPDGQPIVLSSKVSSTTNSSSLTVMFDTGFSLNQVPKYDPFSWNMAFSLILVLLDMSPMRSILAFLEPSSQMSQRLVPFGPCHAKLKSTLPSYSATCHTQSIR
jgi:hypothetical protein